MNYRRKFPKQETWVMRKLGKDFNPDKVCPYTGKLIYPMPLPHDITKTMFYRSDGARMGLVDSTPEEIAWIKANPEAWQKEIAEFDAWDKKWVKE